MKLAVTYDHEMVGQHFGRTEFFKIYDISDGKVVSSEVVPTNGTGHGALAGFLHGRDTDTLICGGIGAGAREMLAMAGIRVYPGVMGNVDESVKSFLSGSLAYDPDTACSHHDHEHGEGHGCGTHGCH